MCACVFTTCNLSLKLHILCCETCVVLRKNMLSGDMSLVKPESLYAYYNAKLIQRINFLDTFVYMYRPDITAMVDWA